MANRMKAFFLKGNTKQKEDIPYADATRDLKKSEFSNLDAFWNQQKRL